MNNPKTESKEILSATEYKHVESIGRV